jgi:hypothetical protein
MNSGLNAGKDIKKVHVEASVLFAINHIPTIDKPTLEKYLELINITGTFGAITEEELLAKMQLMLKHVPQACEYSLSTVAELLGICFSRPAQQDKVVGRIGPALAGEPRRAAISH